MLFSLEDSRRMRGIAKLCEIHVRTTDGTQTVEHLLYLKVDARKSFSNVAFKTYYSRSTHASFSITNELTAEITQMKAHMTESKISHTRGWVGRRLPEHRHVNVMRHPQGCLVSGDMCYRLNVVICRITSPNLRICSISVVFPAGSVYIHREGVEPQEQHHVIDTTISREQTDQDWNPDEDNENSSNSTDTDMDDAMDEEYDTHEQHKRLWREVCDPYWTSQAPINKTTASELTTSMLTSISEQYLSCVCLTCEQTTDDVNDVSFHDVSLPMTTKLEEVLHPMWLDFDNSVMKPFLEEFVATAHVAAGDILSPCDGSMDQTLVP